MKSLSFLAELYLGSEREVESPAIRPLLSGSGFLPTMQRAKTLPNRKEPRPSPAPQTHLPPMTSIAKRNASCTVSGWPCRTEMGGDSTPIKARVRTTLRPTRLFFSFTLANLMASLSLSRALWKYATCGEQQAEPGPSFPPYATPLSPAWL